MRVAMSAGDVRPAALRAEGSASGKCCPDAEELHKVMSPDAEKKGRGSSSGSPRENLARANVVMRVFPQKLLLPMLAGVAAMCCALPLWWACPPGGCVSFESTVSDKVIDIVLEEPVVSDKSLDSGRESTESPEVFTEELPNTSVPLYQTLVGPPSQTDKAWENVPFPIIALLILAGYALTILAIMYLPALLGPEACMWAMLTALALLLTWKWWSNLLLEFVLFAYRWPLNCSAVFGVACCVLYPIVRIMNDDYQRNLLYGLTKAYFGYGDNETRFLGEQVRSAPAEEQPMSKLVRLPLGDSVGTVPASRETFHASSSWLPVAAPVVTKAVAKPTATAVPLLCGGMSVGQDTSPASSVGEALQRNPSGLPVFLHLYDVSNDGRIEKFNSLLSPLKLGGIFHVGIEVNGREWSFGHCPFGSGVCGLKPRTHPSHNFRDTMELRPTQLSEQQVVRILETMSSEYQGSDYNLLRRNCIHFADDLCSRLGVGGVPRWVHRLVRKAEWLCDGVLRIAQIFEDISGLDEPSAKEARLL